MKTTFVATTLGLLVLVTQAAVAQDSHDARHAAAATTPAAATKMSEGTVRKVDKTTGKITIAHGPLENLGMPAMTMAFRASDAAMLDQVKAGDRIRFVADRVDGVFTVTALEAAK